MDRKLRYSRRSLKRFHVSTSHRCSRQHLSWGQKSEGDSCSEGLQLLSPVYSSERVRQMGSIEQDSCNKQCFTLYCCLSGPKLPPISPGHPIPCAVILSFIHFPWYVGEREKQRSATIHPSWLSRPQLSLGIVAETSKMTAGNLEKLPVNDDDEPDVRGEGE